MTITEAPPIRVAIYTRISRDKRQDQAGVKRQEGECRDLACRLGWEVEEVYADDDRSAYSGKPRPEYRRLLEDLKRGAYQGLVIWHPDRLHRSPAELEEFIPIIESTHTNVATVRAGDWDLASATGRMQARIVGVVARHESEHMGERITAKHVQMASEGRWAGGRRPYGYRLSGGTLEVDEKEARVIREVAERVLAGERLHAILTDLNARGIPNARGKHWRQTTLHQVMTAPRTAGFRAFRGEVVGKATWEPILDEATWRKVRVRLSGAPRHPNYRHQLLSGLLVCGECGAGMVGNGVQGGRGNTGRYYRCPPPGSRLGHTCGHRWVGAARSERYVVGKVLERIGDRDIADMVAKRRTDETDEAIRERLAQVDARLDEAADMLSSGVMDRRRYIRATANLYTQADGLRAELAVLGRQKAPSALDGIGRINADTWPTLSAGHRRAVLDALLAKVEVGPAAAPGIFDPGRLAIHWRV